MKYDEWKDEIVKTINTSYNHSLVFPQAIANDYTIKPVFIYNDRVYSTRPMKFEALEDIEDYINSRYDLVIYYTAVYNDEYILRATELDNDALEGVSIENFVESTPLFGEAPKLGNVDGLRNQLNDLQENQGYVFYLHKVNETKEHTPTLQVDKVAARKDTGMLYV